MSQDDEDPRTQGMAVERYTIQRLERVACYSFGSLPTHGVSAVQNPVACNLLFYADTIVADSC